jgi:hypothetical protein
MWQRFVDRYRLRLEEKAQENRGKNPLTWLALLALLFIAIDSYRVFVLHQFTWRVVFGDTLYVAFLVLYARHSRFAWLVIPAIGLIGLLQSLFIFVYPAPYPLRVRCLTFCIAVALRTPKTSNQKMQRTAGRSAFPLSTFPRQ